tara:strand:+ start:3096 stop:4283 length:1188 start_codon:yes stop_codon:yes gene_type:complete
MEENKTEEPVVDNTVGKLKIKKKMKSIKAKPEGDVAKVELNKPKEEPTKEPVKDEVKEDNADNSGVVELVEDAKPTEKQEEVQPEAETQEAPVLEEVTEEVKEQTEELAEEIIEAKETGKALPENLQKVVDFMEETGGNLEDYVRLNQDYSGYDDMTVLREYYKQTKSHLAADEVDFLIEEQFKIDEEVDEERDIKRKKIALKEQVASAKAHLDRQKSKYYEEIKAGSKLTSEQQKAIDFFNRYNKQEEENKKVANNRTSTFVNKTNQVFSDKFKGFEYKVGDKRYRFNVKNADEVKKTQSDLTNFTKKFLDKNNMMSDAMGYHKSLFTAMNSDAIANHFYEQGKADALKDSIAKSKNVNMDPRQSMPANNNTSGPKFRVLSDDSTSSYGFKSKK